MSPYIVWPARVFFAVMFLLICYGCIRGLLSSRRRKHQLQTDQQLLAKRTPNLVALLDRADDADESAIVEINDTYMDWMKLFDRAQAIGSDLYRRLDCSYGDFFRYADYKQNIQGLLETAQAQNTIEAYRLLLEGHAYTCVVAIQKNLGTSTKDQRAKLNALIQAEYEALLPLFASDREAFMKLGDLIRRTRYQTGRSMWRRSGGGLVAVGAKELAHPEGWNDCVAKYLRNPNLTDFVDVPEPHDGELRLWAAEALRTKNLTNAKIILAMVNWNSGYHDGVENVLRADLGRFVDAKNAELGLAAADQQVTED
jgi:hypothetical protein